MTGEPYNSWIAREVVAAAGLTETAPDMQIEGGPLARGHGLKLPLGRRAVLDGDAPTHALASATGFVSTAADLARFFGQLSPGASESVLSPESRREMSRRQWRTPHSEQERYYGLGTMSGEVARRAWFGHIGVFPGYVSRTVVAPEWDVAVSIVTNANDGLSIPWIDGALQIMNAFALNGAPAPAVADWTGRWWSHWGPVDLVPMGDKVVAAVPAALTPLADASEISVTDRLLGRIALANGYGNHGETVRRVADASGDIRSVWLGGIELASEADLRGRADAAASVSTLVHRSAPIPNPCELQPIASPCRFERFQALARFARGDRQTLRRIGRGVARRSWRFCRRSSPAP